MLNYLQLKNYRQCRGLTQRDVCDYCAINISNYKQYENGYQNLNKRAHDEIIKGINLAYTAKKNGTLKSAIEKEKNKYKYPTITKEEYEKIKAAQDAEKAAQKAAKQAEKVAKEAEQKAAETNEDSAKETEPKKKTTRKRTTTKKNTTATE